MKEAGFYEKLQDDDVHCFLCAQHCRIKPGERGLCGVRENRAGVLETLSYARPIAAHVDPIEKKPLYHFRPGTLSYSIGTMGCNFTCSFCQNADIAQGPGQTRQFVGEEVRPSRVVENAKASDCATIAYTYTEPTIFLEYALDTAIIAKSEGLDNVFVTNGFMTRQALDAASPYLDAANVDLKAFRDDFYREQCGARLKPVLESIRAMKEKNIWIEVTTLVIPGLNDDPGELRELAEFLVSVGREIPWHVTAFHPTHRLTDRGRTPAETLHEARRIGLEAGLMYVYTGNVPGEEGRHTYCPKCGEKSMDRGGFRAETSGMTGGECAKCGWKVHGVGLS
jgi:pyruvate formate lyase activating enzyme